MGGYSVIRFNYNGNRYPNAVDMSKDMKPLTSVLVNYTEDAEIACANAAALCYDSRVSHAYGLNKVGKKVLEHCMESGHNTVLEHGVATFVKKVPIFVARQDLRSRIASFDERSLRYCRASDGTLEYYIPDYLSIEHITAIGESGDYDQANILIEMRKNWIETHEKVIWLYSDYTDEEVTERIGVGGERLRETMRAMLPLGISTVYMDTRNIWSWIHHSKKRLCLRAQEEIRKIREQEVDQLTAVYPNIFSKVGRPCRMNGCEESTPCGLVKLDSNRKERRE